MGIGNSRNDDETYLSILYILNFCTMKHFLGKINTINLRKLQFEIFYIYYFIY